MTNFRKPWWTNYSSRKLVMTSAVSVGQWRDRIFAEGSSRSLPGQLCNPRLLWAPTIFIVAFERPGIQRFVSLRASHVRRLVLSGSPCGSLTPANGQYHRRPAWRGPHPSTKDPKCTKILSTEAKKACPCQKSRKERRKKSGRLVDPTMSSQ